MRWAATLGLVAALGLGALGAAASTTVVSAVAYEGHGTWGEIAIHAQPGASFSVWGEQGDGTYATVCEGMLGAEGYANVLVPEQGPTNGQPQFYVSITSGGGGSGIIAITEPEFEWNWN